MPTPRFDWSINLGHILIVVGMLITAATTYTSVMITLTEHELRLKSVEASLPKLELMRENLAVISRDIAVIRERLTRAIPERAETPISPGQERR